MPTYPRVLQQARTVDPTATFVQVAGDIGGTAASPEVTATHLAAALPVAQGGTGATDAPAAVAALGAAPATGNAFATGDATLPRTSVNSNGASLPTGTMRIGYFTASKTETITQVRIGCGATAAGATPTLVRVGIFSVAGNGDLALIASTPNDTTLLATQATMYTKALSAPWAKTAGVRYAVGILVVTGATAPTTFGQTQLPAAELAAAPMLCAILSGQTDLPASVAAGSLTATTAMPYAVFLP